MHAHVQRIPSTLLKVIRRSEAGDLSPSQVVDEMADEIVHSATASTDGDGVPRCRSFD